MAVPRSCVSAATAESTADLSTVLEEHASAVQDVHDELFELLHRLRKENELFALRLSKDMLVKKQSIDLCPAKRSLHGCRNATSSGTDCISQDMFVKKESMERFPAKGYLHGYRSESADSSSGTDGIDQVEEVQMHTLDVASPQPPTTSLFRSNSSRCSIESTEPRVHSGPRHGSSETRRPDSLMHFVKSASEGKNSRPGMVFVDAERMKEQVRNTLRQKEYNVMDHYKEIGLFQAIARSWAFEQLTLSIIAMNAVWIWIETDLNNADIYLESNTIFQVADNWFCWYFALEWIVRLKAFRYWAAAIQDRWFSFDSILVALMVAETWIMSAVLWLVGFGTNLNYGDASILRLLRLVRLTRMARMTRLLRVVPELVIMVKGIAVAGRSVLFTLAFLFVVLYFFAIAFKQLSNETRIGTMYFSTVGHSMATLLLHGCFGEDLPDVAGHLSDHHILFAALLMVFVLIASLTIMNMLVGVLVEVVSVVSKVEKEQIVVSFVKQQLSTLLSAEKIDSDENGRISKDEFENLVLNPKGSQVIHDVGVDVEGLVDFMDFIFGEDNAEITFDDFMDIILQLRGTNSATVKDIVDLRKFIMERLDQNSVATAGHGENRDAGQKDAARNSIAKRSALKGLGIRHPTINPHKARMTAHIRGTGLFRQASTLEKASAASQPAGFRSLVSAEPKRIQVSSPKFTAPAHGPAILGSPAFNRKDHDEVKRFLSANSVNS
eukprot:TRINITY_DN33994_c0_g1_i1.p1 TRINITY_DN33994_c0_g1~~TRINITY_DN33994_c0_g1_i1.p1  ORF type:complete len:738 (-),score=115.54 TRINITY_DN33994_c0_g1_i1:302-2470(-)